MKQPSTPRSTLWLPALLLLALAVFTGACGEAVSSQPRPAETAVTLLKKAAAKIDSARSYHLVARGQEPGRVVTTTWDIDNAGHSYHLTADFAQMAFDEIGAGGYYYLSTNSPALGLENQPYSRSSVETDTQSTLLMRPLKDRIDIIGPGPASEHLTINEAVPPTETINGIATVHVTSTFTDAMWVDNANSTVDYWLSTEDDPSFFRISVTHPAASTDAPSQFLTRETFTWSNFDQDFDIKPPAQWVGSPTP